MKENRQLNVLSLVGEPHSNAFGSKKVNLAHPMVFLGMGKCPAEKCKAEANQGKGSNLREVLREAPNPCPADKTHTPFARLSSWCTEH